MKIRAAFFSVILTSVSFGRSSVSGTKNREPWITAEIEQRIWAFLGGIARENRLKPLQIGGVGDHIHLLLCAPATMAPAKAAQLIKGGSSARIHTEFPVLCSFAWQDSYGPSQIELSWPTLPASVRMLAASATRGHLLVRQSYGAFTVSKTHVLDVIAARRRFR